MKHWDLNKRILKYLPFLAICLLGILIYSNTFHGPFIFDDAPYIEQNYDIHNIADIGKIWERKESRFIGMLSFALNYHFHQTDVFGYHLVNLVIHLINSILVFWFVNLLLLSSRIPKDSMVQNKKAIAFSVAILFLSHPMQTQAVTYITQRFASLATMFYMASLCFYIKGRLKSNGNESAVAFYFGSAVSALLGMLTKEIVITLPLVILFIELFLLENQQFSQKVKQRKYWICLSLIFLMLLIVPFLYATTYTSIKSVGSFFAETLSQSHRGDIISGKNYYLTQFRVVATYIKLLFVPIGQNFDYDFAASKSLFEIPTFLCFLLILSILLFAVKIYSRQKMISVGIFWFFLTMSLESSFFPIRNVIFEHRMYLPSVGFFLALCIFIYRITKNLKVFVVVISIITVILSFLTYQRNRVWQNEVVFWKDVVKKSPNKARPYSNLGHAYVNIGKPDLALENFDMVFKVDPEWVYRDLAYVGRGVIYGLGRKQYELAIENFNKAIEINPYNWEAYFNRGNTSAQEGYYDLAIQDYTKALGIKPQAIHVYIERGNAYTEKGQYDLAISNYDVAIEHNPRYARAYFEKGNLYYGRGIYDRAFDSFKKTLELNPRFYSAYNKTGIIYEKQKKYDLAFENYAKALIYKPDFPEAHFNRGNIYLRMGEYDLAIDDYNDVLSINPDYQSVYYSRGLAYVGKKEYQRALADFNKVISMDPSRPKVYIRRAKVFFKLNELEKSLMDYGKVIEADPKHAEAYFGRSLVYHAKNDFKNALNDAVKAQTLGYNIEDSYIKEIKEGLSKQ